MADKMAGPAPPCQRQHGLQRSTKAVDKFVGRILPNIVERAESLAPGNIAKILGNS